MSTGWLDEMFEAIEPPPPPDPVAVIDTRQGERTIVYWPSGVAANGVALSEAAITTLQTEAATDGVSQIHLVIDGSAVDGLVTMSGSHNLFTSVRFRNCRTLTLGHTTANAALFRNTSSLVAEGILRVQRGLGSATSTALLRCDIPGINSSIHLENIRFATSQGGGTGPMVNLRNGARHVEWRNCGLHSLANGLDANCRLLRVENVAPAELNLYWVGEFAGRLGGNNFLQTVAVGGATWQTTMYYGSPFGWFLTPTLLTNQDWSAGSITLQDARTVQQILQRETFAFDFVDGVYLQFKPSGNTVAGVVPAVMGFHAGSHGVGMFNDNTGNDPAFSVLLFVPIVVWQVRVIAVVIGDGDPGDTGNATLEVSCGSGGAKATKSFQPSRTQHEAITLYEGPVSGINAPGSDGAGGVTLLAVGRASNADAWPNSVFIKRLIIEWAQLSLV